MRIVYRDSVYQAINYNGGSIINAKSGCCRRLTLNLDDLTINGHPVKYMGSVGDYHIYENC